MTEEMKQIEKTLGWFTLLVCAGLLVLVAANVVERLNRAEKSLAQVSYDMSVKLEEYCRNYCLAAGGGAISSYFSDPEQEGPKYRVECECVKPEVEE